MVMLYAVPVDVYCNAKFSLIANSQIGNNLNQ